MPKKKQDLREQAFKKHLADEGFTADEIAWESEQPHIRQARRSFYAGWEARQQRGEIV